MFKLKKGIVFFLSALAASYFFFNIFSGSSYNSRKHQESQEEEENGIAMRDRADLAMQQEFDMTRIRQQILSRVNAWLWHKLILKLFKINQQTEK